MSVTNPLRATTDATFAADVLQASGLVVVDFWAEWCIPCRGVTASLSALAPDFAGQTKIYSLNADENPETAAELGVRGLPTVLLFRRGKVVQRIIGAQSKQKFREAIEANL